MTSMMIEAVVLAFCMGGAFGAIVAMHLQYKGAKQQGHNLKQAEVRIQHRRHLK